MGWPFSAYFSPNMKHLAMFWNRKLDYDTDKDKATFGKSGRGLWLITNNATLDISNAKHLKRGSVFPFGWSQNSDFIYASVSDEPVIYVFNNKGTLVDSIKHFALDVQNDRNYYNFQLIPKENKFIIERHDKRNSDLWILTNFDPEF